MNILDKTDMSLAPIPYSPSITKREKFSWATGGTTGVFRWIDKRNLNIDGCYQREAASKAKILDIAREWDWLLLGAISVIERSDGSYVVFDGGHRTRASFYRDDIDTLPCMVYQVATLTNEAKAFVACNTMTSNVDAIDRHKASVCAEEPVAIRVSELLSSCGICIAKTPHGTSQIQCIGAIASATKEDAATAKRCLLLCIELATEYNESVEGAVFSGLFRLARSIGDNMWRHEERIKRHSQKEIAVRIRQYRAETGKGGQTIAAKAIMHLINKGLRNKLTWH